MTQVKPFVIANAGTTKYLCLQNVRLGYGIPAYYLTATKAWNGTQQHRDRNFPSGCSVPVFYSWTGTVDGVRDNYGHIAVRLADGRVWSDGKYFANVDALVGSYLSNGSYLGWGESVNNVKVVTEVSMAETINDDVARQIGWHYLGRNGYDGKPNALQSSQNDIKGKPLTNAQLSTFFLSAEARDWRDSRIHKVYAERDGLKSQNSNLVAERDRLAVANAELTKTVSRLNGEVIGLAQTVKEKQAEINTLQDQVVDLEKENKELKAQLATCGGDDTELLNSFGEILRKLIERIGLKK